MHSLWVKFLFHGIDSLRHYRRAKQKIRIAAHRPRVRVGLITIALPWLEARKTKTSKELSPRLARLTRPDCRKVTRSNHRAGRLGTALGLR